MDFNNKFQFSKIIIILCIILAIVGCATAVILPIPDTVAIALITAGGSLATTSVIWNLKKSQAENTLKIYLSAYEHIIDLKHQYHNDNIEDEADETCGELEDKILNKIDQSFDTTMDDATSLLEKQEIG